MNAGQWPIFFLLLVVISEVVVKTGTYRAISEIISRARCFIICKMDVFVQTDALLWCIYIVVLLVWSFLSQIFASNSGPTMSHD